MRGGVFCLFCKAKRDSYNESLTPPIAAESIAGKLVHSISEISRFSLRSLCFAESEAATSTFPVGLSLCQFINSDNFHPGGSDVEMHVATNDPSNDGGKMRRKWNNTHPPLVFTMYPPRIGL